MASRTSISRAGVVAGVGAGAAAAWLLGTAAGRSRLAGLLGRHRSADEEHRITHIELPDRPWLRDIGISVDEGIAAGTRISGAEEATATPA
ncbi:MAG TPA: hypothetical protein VG266_04820 [Candidatus Dormibacteraeota bacterium]|jgi:hypothetical protein|nr:hypothetical protein [Candidatus Dormibacteraeota bacterium]